MNNPNPSGHGPSPARGYRANYVDNGVRRAKPRTYHRCETCGAEWRTSAKAARCCKIKIEEAA